MSNLNYRLEVRTADSGEDFTILVPLNVTFGQIARNVHAHVSGMRVGSDTLPLVLTKAGELLSNDLKVGESNLRNGDEIFVSSC